MEYFFGHERAGLHPARGLMLGFGLGAMSYLIGLGLGIIISAFVLIVASKIGNRLGFSTRSIVFPAMTGFLVAMFFGFLFVESFFFWAL